MWKSIKGYEGMYEISKEGEVRSVPRTTHYKDGRIGIHKGRVLKQQNTKKGYLRVDLTKDGVRRSHQIHRLVAEAFIPNPEGKEQVNHRDGCKLNNAVSNLEWNSNEENILHANENGLRGVSRQPKEVEQYDMQGNLIGTYRSFYNAALAVEGDSYKISLVCRGKRKSHKGFIWKTRG